MLQPHWGVSKAPQPRKATLREPARLFTLFSPHGGLCLPSRGPSSFMGEAGTITQGMAWTYDSEHRRAWLAWLLAGRCPELPP